MDKLKGKWSQFPHAKMAMSEISDAGATFGSTISEAETTEAPSDTIDAEDLNTDSDSDFDDEEFVIGNEVINEPEETEQEASPPALARSSRPLKGVDG